MIIPNIMLRRGRQWNGGYKLVVRLGATANKKERSCPRFLIVEFFGVRAVHEARSDDEGASPIFGARARRDRKQASEQLLISLLVRTALEPATRPLYFRRRLIAFVAFRRCHFRCEIGAVCQTSLAGQRVIDYANRTVGSNPTLSAS